MTTEQICMNCHHCQVVHHVINTKVQYEYYCHIDEFEEFLVSPDTSCVDFIEDQKA